MDIDTSSITAARRNLILISIGFILYSVGDAELIKSVSNNGMEVSKITVLFGSFDINPNVLSCFSKIMFAWFLLRFWQFSKHKQDWHRYTSAMYDSKFMLQLFAEKELTRYSKNHYRHPIQNESYLPFFGIWEWVSTADANLVIQKNQWLQKIVLFINVAITTELFGQYYFPYCLALAAVVVSVVW